MKRYARFYQNSKPAPDRGPLAPGEQADSLARPSTSEQDGEAVVPIAPLIAPALEGPRQQATGEPYDGYSDYWQARQAVLAFLRSPHQFAAGFVEELRRQGTSVIGTLVALENAVVRRREQRA